MCSPGCTLFVPAAQRRPVSRVPHHSACCPRRPGSRGVVEYISIAVDVRRRRARADGGEEREPRAELACEVVHPEICAIDAQFFRGYRELDRLQKRIRRGAYVRVRRWCPVPEGEKTDLFHATIMRFSRLLPAGEASA